MVKRLGKILLTITILFTMFGGTGANIVQAASNSNYRIIKVNSAGEYSGYYSTVNIEKGKTQKFRLFNGTKAVTTNDWTIGSTQVATISKSGGVVTVKGIKEGTTSLKCKYAGKEYMITIKVIDNGNTTYKIYPSTTSINVADTTTFELRENNKTVMCTWQVSNPEILKLEITQGKAKVTGLKAGNCTLKAYRKWKIKMHQSNNC